MINPSTPILYIGLEEVLQFAKKLASILKRGDCISFEGDLGAGKTTIIRHMIQALSSPEIGVSSPTFNIMQSYDVTLQDGTGCIFYHYDLYRLQFEEEISELPLREGFDEGVSCIEWPALAEATMPDSRIGVNIEFSENNDNRRIWLQAAPEQEQRLREAGLWH